MSNNFNRKVGEWRKIYRKEIVLGLLVFLVASLSFSLGYTSGSAGNQAPIIIEKCSEMGESDGSFF